MSGQSTFSTTFNRSGDFGADRRLRSRRDQPTRVRRNTSFVTESLVEGAFDQLRDELGPDAQAAIDAVEAELHDGLQTTQSVSQAGVSAFTDSTADSNSSGGFDYHDILQHIGTPLFVLDPDGDILSWNSSIENLTGVSEAEAKEMEMASMAFYPDGRRGQTLADKVLDAPETTHTEYDVPKVEDEDFTLYRDTSVMADQHGNERHISFSAAPIYDDDGELIAVVETVQDRTDVENDSGRPRRSSRRSRPPSGASPPATSRPGRRSRTTAASSKTRRWRSSDAQRDGDPVERRQIRWTSRHGNSQSRRAASRPPSMSRTSTNSATSSTRARHRCSSSARRWRRSPPPPTR